MQRLRRNDRRRRRGGGDPPPATINYRHIVLPTPDRRSSIIAETDCGETGWAVCIFRLLSRLQLLGTNGRFECFGSERLEPDFSATKSFATSNVLCPRGKNSTFLRRIGDPDFMIFRAPTSQLTFAARSIPSSHPSVNGILWNRSSHRLHRPEWSDRCKFRWPACVKGAKQH